MRILCQDKNGYFEREETQEEMNKRERPVRDLVEKILREKGLIT